MVWSVDGLLASTLRVPADPDGSPRELEGYEDCLIESLQAARSKKLVNIAIRKEDKIWNFSLQKTIVPSIVKLADKEVVGSELEGQMPTVPPEILFSVAKLVGQKEWNVGMGLNQCPFPIREDYIVVVKA